MNGKEGFFINELIRFGPFLTVLLATLACLENIREFLAGQVNFTAMVERYFLAFLLAMIAVRLFTKLVLAYAGNDQRNQNVVSASGKSNKKGKK